MTVAELQRILAGVNPDAEVIVTYHISEHEDAGFYEDDVATANYGMTIPDENCDHTMFYLLTDGFCEAAEALGP